MSIVKIIKGDLLSLFAEGEFQLIGHGANCQNLMGAGIAAQVRDKYPDAYAVDAEFHKRLGGQDFKQCPSMAGHISVAQVAAGEGKARIANLYTQISTGANASYQFLQRACEELNKYCRERSITNVGLPLIGCGIGGLDIIAALTIIGACTPDIDVTIVVYSKEKDFVFRQVEKYRNFGFPHKFKGLIIRTGNNTFRVFQHGFAGWKEVTLDMSQVKVMWHNGEHGLSVGNESVGIYLLVNDKEALKKEHSRMLKF